MEKNMELTEITKLFLGLLGGISLFLFGMNIMGDSLERSAGNKLKSILGKLTDSPVRGFILGAGVTAIIQSSSATTVMLVGFVNSGLMTLKNAIPIIMGANVGTTVTAWLLSLTAIEGDSFFIEMLKPTSFTPILAVIGIVLYMFISSPKKKDIGLILIGFSVLIFGMDMMSDAVSPLRDVPEFAEILIMFKNPILGVLMGAVLTAIIQSSSASVGILQALSSTGAVSFGAAIPIIMGQNIGTCVTALISSVGANKNAKRVGFVHLCFNIIGTVVILILFYTANAIFTFEFVDKNIGAAEIATVHTIFNLACTALLLPFAKLLERLAKIIIKDTDKEASARPELLEARLIATPPIAIMHAGDVTKDMARAAHASLLQSFKLFDSYSDELFGDVVADEDRVDIYEDEIGSYLMNIASRDINHADSLELTKLLHVIGDLERLSDHSVNLAESAREMHEKRISFSEEAREELAVISSAISEILELTKEAFCTDSVDMAMKVEPLEEVIDTLTDSIKFNHITRLKNGECTIELGFILTDILTNLERISDHCSNIAGCMLEVANNSLGMHGYYRSIKAGNETYDKYLEHYQGKYMLLPAITKI